MRNFAYLVYALLWLTITLSPTIIGISLGFLISAQAGDTLNSSVFIVGMIGFLFGVRWAEHVRKTIGLSQFFGRISGTPELNKKDH